MSPAFLVLLPTTLLQLHSASLAPLATQPLQRGLLSVTSANRDLLLTERDKLAVPPAPAIKLTPPTEQGLPPQQIVSGLYSLA